MNKRGERRSVFVSLSGIDGSGKSTQIEALARYFTQNSLRVHVVRFWDDIARLKEIRETSGHKIFKGDKGVGSPSAPIHRRDKNVQSGLMTGVRLFLYFVDALATRLAVNKVLGCGYDLVIFDRYMYDELANLNLGNPIIRGYVRMIMSFIPRPEVSYLLDADPVEARTRKPEYPLEFVRANREAYLKLADLVGGLTVIHAMPVQEVEAEVVAQAVRRLPNGAAEHRPGNWAVEGQ